MSRRNFSYFVKTLHRKYIMGWFHQVLCDALQRFYDDVQSGKNPRLMIFAPPRHGKSELFSRYFPAWCFGKDPDLEFIACSHTADLAKKMNRSVRRIIKESRYMEIFPETKLNKDLQNTKEFAIERREGIYLCSGVDGPITGTGADIAIIDDPVKDGADANSEIVRERTWEWYMSTFHTRLSPKGGILLAMTRWHEDDLAGRLLEQMRSGDGEQWDILKFPAIAEHDEEHRREGEALHIDRYPLEKLLRKKRMEGEYRWQSLYQQNPSSKGMNAIDITKFKKVEVIPPLLYKEIFVDTAQKDKEINDYSVLQCWGKLRDGGAILLDQIRGKWDSDDLKHNAIAFWSKHKKAIYNEGLLWMCIEDKINGTSLIQQIKRQGSIPVYEIKALKSKVMRFHDVSPYIKSGMIYLNVSNRWPTDWLLDFEAECMSFRLDMTHKHDDQIDAMVYAIHRMLADKNETNIADWKPEETDDFYRNLMEN